LKKRIRNQFETTTRGSTTRTAPRNQGTSRGCK